jgi:hypothetical protein
MVVIPFKIIEAFQGFIRMASEGSLEVIFLDVVINDGICLNAICPDSVRNTTNDQ